jgi:para-nitrobenzyl esterase
MIPSRIAPLFGLVFFFACGGGADATIASPEAPEEIHVKGEGERLPPEVGPNAAGVIPHQPGLLIATSAGFIHGAQEGALRVFKGIPFAEAPIGERRFSAPVAKAPWQGVRETTHFGPGCPQDTTGLALAMGEEAAASSEDCLSLNVWAHDDGESPEGGGRPVMVWVYGGGFVTGGSAWPTYDGASLAQNGDVVVVTLNYRLGMLGFLSTEALRAENADGAVGNWGLKDQVEALRWVRDNIAAFGGDPDNVTLFGESAGAISVCALMGAPEADTLFHRAIIESGMCTLAPVDGSSAPGGIFAGMDVLEAGEALVDAVGCGDAFDPVACLRGVPVDALVAQASVASIFTGDLEAIGAVTPVVDGVFIPKQPLDRLAQGAPDRPLIVGSNRNEGRLFSVAEVIVTRWDLERRFEETVGEGPMVEALMDLYPWQDFLDPKDAWVAFMGEITFICPGLRAAEVTHDGAPAYTYHFTRDALLSPMGDGHAGELVYVFSTFDTMAQVPTDADRQLSVHIQKAWSSFAHGGVPETDPTWERYRSETPFILILDEEIRGVEGIRNGRCEALQDMGLVY